MLMAKGQESQPLLISHLLSLAKVSHMAEARVSGQGRKPCSEVQRAWTQGEVRNQGRQCNLCAVGVQVWLWNRARPPFKLSSTKPTVLCLNQEAGILLP